MNSSTSSSRPIFARVLLVTVLGMGLALALVRLLGLVMGVSGEDFLSRELQAQAALPRIVAEQEPLVLFFGSSMTQAGFSARQFDRQLAERGVTVKSFNFGFGGLNPLFQDYLARRIREAFENEDRRLELALIEFNPFQVTKRRYQGAEALIDAYVGMFASPAEMWEILRRDPTRGLRILVIHYLRDDVSAEMITWAFGRPFRPPIPKSDLPENEEAQAKLEEIGAKMGEKFEEEYPDYDGADWSYAWQGAGTIPEERSAETLELFREYYATLNHDKHMADDREWRAYCCDILELDFHDRLVEAFIRMVQEFQQFSNQVEVVLLPRNTDWIEYTPEAAARLDAVLERIRRETGVTIRNFQDVPEITPEMFSDTTHLARYLGDVPFTEFLVEQYEDDLRGEAER